MLLWQQHAYFAANTDTHDVRHHVLLLTFVFVGVAVGRITYVGTKQRLVIIESHGCALSQSRAQSHYVAVSVLRLGNELEHL